MISVEQHLILRKPTEDDAEAIFSMVDKNREHLKDFPWVEETLVPEDSNTFIKSINHTSLFGNRYSLVIEHDQQHVGMIGFHKGSEKNKMLEIGYWISKDYMGKGIITKSCAALINYAFTSTDVNRIVLRCSTTNFKSQAVAERLGFIREGVERQASNINGKFLDLNRNSILRQEWESQRKVAGVLKQT